MHEPQFSHRTAWELRENALTRLARCLREEGKEIHDWTIANPTVCGFSYDRQRIAKGLGDPSSFVYEPEPPDGLAVRVICVPGGAEDGLALTETERGVGAPFTFTNRGCETVLFRLSVTVQ